LDPQQNVFEIDLGINAVKFARGRERVDVSDVGSAVLVANEEVVLTLMRYSA
jgi:hypothetical protein